MKVSKDYNPLDVLKREDVLAHLHNLQADVCKSSKLDIEAKATKAIFCNVVGITNFIGEGIAWLNSWRIKNILREILVQQINYLNGNVEYLCREVRINLAISLLLMRDAFEMSEKMNYIGTAVSIIWKAIKNFSLSDGLVDHFKEEIDKWDKEKWVAMLYPISLIMNVWVNKDIDNKCRQRIDSILKELIKAANSTWQIDDVIECKLQLLSNGTLLQYYDSRFDEIRNSQSYLVAVQENFEEIENTRKRYTEERKEEAKKVIQELCEKYHNGVNDEIYLRVKNTYSKVSGIPINQITLDTYLTDTTLRKNFYEEYSEWYSVEVPQRYIDEITSLNELVSYLKGINEKDDEE